MFLLLPLVINVSIATQDCTACQATYSQEHVLSYLLIGLTDHSTSSYQHEQQSIYSPPTGTKVYKVWQTYKRSQPFI